VDNSVRVLKAVGRPNFGIIYEPANWMIAGEDYGVATLRKLRPYLFNVYVQNHRLNPNGSAAVVTWRKGKVPLDHIGIWEKGGVDYDAVAAGLRDVGYRGYVTVHQAFGDVMPVEDAVRRSREHLGRILPAAT
jgi:sugar phosphate isomerase/epimerase